MFKIIISPRFYFLRVTIYSLLLLHFSWAVTGRVSLHSSNCTWDELSFPSAVAGRREGQDSKLCARVSLLFSLSWYYLREEGFLCFSLHNVLPCY